MQGVYRAPDIDADGRAGQARLADLGQSEAALTACEQAAAIRRELATAHPDAFGPFGAVAPEPVDPPRRPGPARGRSSRRRGGCAALPRAGGGTARRLPL